MKKLYIVFDQLPLKTSGGLIATYVNLINLLKDEYDIKIISVFNYDKEASNDFNNTEIIALSNVKINNRFYQMFNYLKHLSILKFLFACFSFFYFFLYIPIGRIKIRKLINNDDKVIACAPASAIFIAKAVEFILEIHINFEYFWGNNWLGKFQVMLMSKPKLTLFRNKHDASKGKKLFKASYIYNFFDSSNINKPNFDFQTRRNKIMFMGRLSYQKNPLRLLELASLLKKQKPEFVLDIYGDGPMCTEMKKEIISRNLQDNVHLCGFTTNKSIYNEYSLLWLTSEFEGFGLVIIEAKANMVPTISVEWGKAVYEVIQNKVDGFIVNDNEEFIKKTIKLLDDEILLKQFSEASLLDFNTRFSKDSFKDKWIHILEDYKSI